jgi:LPS export ABC transporter protein LptC
MAQAKDSLCESTMINRFPMKPRVAMWSVGLAGLLTGVLVLGGCGSQEDTPVVSPDLLEVDADGVIYGMRSLITLEGVREGMVRADTAYFYEDSSSVELRQLSLTVYTEDGRERALVTAERGWLNVDTNEMVARGNAVLTVRADGRIIESAELNYNPNEDRIWSDSATVQRLDGTVSEGSSFESDLEFTNVRIVNMRTRGGAIRY